MYKKFFVFGVLLFLSVPLANAEDGWKKMEGRNTWETVIRQGGQITELGVTVKGSDAEERIVFFAHRQCKNSKQKQTMLWNAGDTKSIVRDCTNQIWTATPIQIEIVAPPLPEIIQKKIREMKIRRGTLIISETHPSGAFFFA